jgi:hypothetical protein
MTLDELEVICPAFPLVKEPWAAGDNERLVLEATRKQPMYCRCWRRDYVILVVEGTAPKEQYLSAVNRSRDIQIGGTEGISNFVLGGHEDFRV